jgi:hypothetical protein
MDFNFPGYTIRMGQCSADNSSQQLCSFSTSLLIHFMKHIIFLSLTVFYISFAHADLSLKIALMGKHGTNSLSGALDRIKGNKIREDQFFEGVNVGNKILNLDTGEEFKLLPDQKAAEKIPFDLSVLTNVIPIDAIKDTGKTGIVDGYDTKIYILTNSDGTTSTIWIAKDFPHFEMIKEELVKRDRFSHAGRIHFSTLPGMLLKSSIDPRRDAPLMQFL